MMMSNVYERCANQEKIASELREWHIDKAPQTLTHATELADEHTAVTNAQHVKPKTVFFTKTQGEYNKAYNNKPRNYFEKHKQGNDVNDKQNKSGFSETQKKRNLPNGAIIAEKTVIHVNSVIV